MTGVQTCALPISAPAPAPAQLSTTAAEAIAGTANGDIFNGSVATAGSTFQAGDSVDGLGGTDTLQLTIGAGVAANQVPATATTANVELIKVTNLSANAQTVDASKFTGATQFHADRGTGAVTFNNLSSSQQAWIAGDGVVVNGATTFAYSPSVPNVTLNLSGGTRGTAAITVTGTGISTSTINSTSAEAGNVVGAIALPATNTGLTINATANLTTGNITGFATTAGTITITGAATSVSIGALAANVSVLDASGLTSGGVTAVLGSATSTITGGGGNDTFTTSSSTFTGSVNAAGGTGDLLIVAASNQMSATLGAKYTNFELLQVNNGVSVNASHVAGITGVRVNAAAGATGFTGLTAAQAANVTVLAGAAGIVTLALADASGTSDTVKIDANDGLATTGTITLTTPVLTGIEKLEIKATDNVTVTSLASAASLTSAKLSGAGTVSLTTGAINNLSSIDGSQATGSLAIDASAITAAAASGLALVGGSGFDTLTGTQKADTYTGGGGQNRFKFTTTATGTPSDTNYDTITDFRTGLFNIIDHANTLAVASVGTGAQGQAFVAASGVASFNSADNTLALHLAAVSSALGATANRVAIWQEGSDAYLFISDAVAGLSATDVLIKLTGVTVGAGGLTIAGGDITAIA